MKMFRLALLTATLATMAATAAAQTATPVPRPFPGAPAPPTSSSPAPSTPAPAPPAQPSSSAGNATPPPAEPAAPTPTLPGVPAIYPAAEYLDTIDAGSGQSYVLYGANAPFAEVVTYYRTVLKNGGREIYRTPAIHQFDLGRYDDNRMAYPPSVVIKDYAGGTSPGYLHVAGTEEKRFRTIIQIVAPATAAR